MDLPFQTDSHSHALRRFSATSCWESHIFTVGLLAAPPRGPEGLWQRLGTVGPESVIVSFAALSAHTVAVIMSNDKAEAETQT